MLAGHVGRRRRPLLDWPDGLARHAVEREDEALLRHLRHRVDSAAVDGDVEQIRRGRRVVVPQPVMHELVVPDAFTGLGIEADQRFRKEIVAGPVSAVIIGRGGVERQVHVPQFFVGAVGRPSADLSCVRPRVVLPRFVAHLTRPRDRVKCPLQFSRPRIQPARPPGNLLLEDVVRRDRSRRDDRVANDDGR